MNPHDATVELLGAWALDAVEDDEATAVEEHLRTCAACAAEARSLREAAGWLGVRDVRPPPATLRDTVLAEAMRRRPPDLMRTLTQAYAAQVELLDETLGAVRADDWAHPDDRHGDVRGLVAHLAANDAMLASDLGGEVLPPRGSDVRAAWRRQAAALLDRLAEVAELAEMAEMAEMADVADVADVAEVGAEPDAATGSAALDVPVRLAARERPPVRPLRDALVQRAFETWTHRADLDAVVGGTAVTPPPAEIRRIVCLAVRVLPGALRETGLVRPGAGVRLLLDGPGEGEWVVPLGHAAAVSHVEATVRGDAVGFTRLVAGRRSVASFDPAVTGEAGVVGPFLEVAATLGCD